MGTVASVDQLDTTSASAIVNGCFGVARMTLEGHEPPPRSTAHRRQGVRKQRASRVQEPANSRSPASCVRIRLRREVLALVAMQREPF